MTFRLRTLALAALSLVIVVAGGCGDGTGATAARAATPAECRGVPNGTSMVSPISGKTITKQSDTPAALYDGKLFFFCCAVDRDKFVAQPQAFAASVLPPNGRIVGK